MGAYRVVVLTCDHDVSGPCVVRRTTPYATKEKARADGALYGWTSKGDWDMCPDHDFPGPIREVPQSTEPEHADGGRDA